MAVEHDGSAADQRGSQASAVLLLELRRLRESRGLTQQEMAKRIGHSARSAVADYESGRRKPPPDILTAYEGVFQLEPGALQGLRDRGLAEQAEQRYVSVLAELAVAEGSVSGPATTAPPVTAPIQGERVRARRTLACLAVLALICIPLTGSADAVPTRGVRLDSSWTQSTQNITDPVEPPSSPEPMDGDDPRARDCYADAVTELTAPMHLPGGALFGTLRLRHSAHCGASWGSAYYANPDLYTIRIIVHRPADGAEIVFDWSNNTPPGSYSDMLSTGLGCVWVEAVVITPRGTSLPARTGCST